MADTASSKEPIDIVILAYQRAEMTVKTIDYINERTNYPYRIFVINNGSTDNTKQLLDKYVSENKIYFAIHTSRNVGVHMGWNIALSLATSKYFITTDNDIYVPKYEDTCWLTKLVNLIETKEDYAAIALQPHNFLGDSLNIENDDDGIIEKPHCGAVMRILEREATVKACGWEKWYDRTRNHEEKTICGRLRGLGLKTGYATHLKAFHDFGTDNNWGYKNIHPHDHGHKVPGDEIWPTPNMLNNINELNKHTWEKI